MDNPNHNVLNLKPHTFPKQVTEKFPDIKQPQMVGEYSVSPEGHFENSGSRMCFLGFMNPNMYPFSLNEYADNNNTREEQPSKTLRYLDNLFYFLKSNSKMLIKRNQYGILQVGFDIVCTREVLQLMMCAPYEYKENWTIAASKYRNTIYLTQVHNSDNSSSFAECQVIESWMQNLRKKCLAWKDISVNPEEMLNGQYYCVMTTHICGLRVLYDATMLTEAGSSKPVNLYMRLDNMERKALKIHKRRNVLKWWSESFLLGIERVYIAYYDREANVRAIRYKPVRELWRECTDNWSTNICANFLEKCLLAIKMQLDHVDCASTVYRFEYNATRGIVSYHVSEKRNEHSFVPDWFRIMMEEPMDHLDSEFYFHP